MTSEELAKRMGVQRAAWKFLGGRAEGGAGGFLNNKLGVSAWDGDWSGGVRIPLSVPGQVSDEEWDRAIAELLAQRPQ